MHLAGRNRGLNLLILGIVLPVFQFPWQRSTLSHTRHSSSEQIQLFIVLQRFDSFDSVLVGDVIGALMNDVLWVASIELGWSDITCRQRSVYYYENTWISILLCLLGAAILPDDIDQYIIMYTWWSDITCRQRSVYYYENTWWSVINCRQRSVYYNVYMVERYHLQTEISILL